MRRIAAVVDDIYEDLELWYPRIRFEEEGWQVLVAGPQAGEVYAGKHGYPCAAQAGFSDLRAEELDALLVPGGFAPDKIRRDARALALVREMNAAGKLIGFICHAGWVTVCRDHDSPLVRCRIDLGTPRELNPANLAGACQ